MSWGQFASYFIFGVLYKCAVEFVLMPVTYTVVSQLKRREPSYSSH